MMEVMWKNKELKYDYQVYIKILKKEIQFIVCRVNYICDAIVFKRTFLCVRLIIVQRWFTTKKYNNNRYNIKL